LRVRFRWKRSSAGDFAYGYPRRGLLFICRLSQSCRPTLLSCKPFEEFTTLRIIWHIKVWGLLFHMGVPGFRGRKDLESNLQPKHALAICCCHIANRNEELHAPMRAISPLLKLFWLDTLFSWTSFTPNLSFFRIQHIVRIGLQMVALPTWRRTNTTLVRFCPHIPDCGSSANE